MQTLRIGVVGLGNMGSHHVRALAAGSVTGATLAAVCDNNPDKLSRITDRYDAPGFSHYDDLFASGAIDAVMIATPHYDHPPIGIAALKKNLHVLVEKPAAVSVTAARQLNAVAAEHPNLVFGIMFNQRARNIWRKMRDLIADGELGEVSRISWIVTDWFRTWTYYASGGWRATWAGEGGGVLLNQCPHNLDLLQWIPNMMPSRITAIASIGKTHPIEVEDEVSAILEYPNGAVGHFITSTGEAPGTNRLEIVGDHGKLVAENNTLHFRRTRQSVRAIREKSPLSFVVPEVWDCQIPVVDNSADEHLLTTQNWVDAILTGSPLTAPGPEGVRGLEIGNAILMAGITRQSLSLPLDGPAFDNLIKELATKYAGQKTLQTKSAAPTDITASFAR